MTAVLRAPRVKLSWTATSLGIYFQAYRVYRRPARTPVAGWQLIAELDVPSGYTATTVEAQHTRFHDYLAGWYSEGGEWADGWDWAVTSVDITGAESQITQSAVTASRLTVPDAGIVWWANNQLPPLNCPVEIPDLTDSATDPGIITRKYVGRDKGVNLGPAELPGRSLTTTAEFFGQVGPDELRALRLAMKSRLQFAMLRPLGDRIVGSPYVAGFSDARVGRQTVRIGINESVEDAVADYNLPAGLVFDGSNDYLTTPSGSHLNPGSSGFSVVIAARFSSTASKYALSKGNLGTADGYGFRTTASANELQWFVDGATTSVGTGYVSTSWFDDVRVAVGTTSGTAQHLYMDGTQVATGSTTHGAVTNSVALAVGANNAGASGWSAITPLRAYAVYLRELTAAEAQAASYYLLGYPNSRMPAGASIFVDLRDDRTWNGIQTSLTDLSPWGNRVTATNGPVTRGIPWPLRRYESV